MSFLSQLNPVQQEAVKAANGPVMIIAGAGSGKTRVLTYRIAWLIECGVPPHQILALTFTNKAANEMKTRIAALVGKHANDLWMGTFHSVFARILRKEAELLGYTRSFTIYDSDDSQQLVKRVMERLNLSKDQFNPNAIRARISTAKNQLISSRQAEEMARDLFDEKAALIYGEYQKQLLNSNAMDFDDLLVNPIHLFEQKPDRLERYQYRFKFILVDEFQDTNRAQYVVTKQLSSQHKNICVVGDDAQSIYSFRGADIQNILSFSKDFPDCQTFRLEQNYRSTKNILAAADKLIHCNREQIHKNLWTSNAEGEAITVFECADDRDEGLVVVDAIQDEIRNKKLDLKDFAVLYRTNAQSRSLEDALRRNGMPYTIVGGIRFYERKEIKDVLAYLRLMVNPKDEESLQRIINYPPRGIGETSLTRVQSFARVNGIGLFEALGRLEKISDLPDRGKRSLSDFVQFIQKHNAVRETMTLSEFSRSLVDELGILRMFKEERTPESMSRWENVQELLSAISEFADNREDATLEDFLQEVSLVSDIDSYEGTRNVVTLMTLHSSKGLEFPVVCITGIEEGLLPFYSSAIEPRDLEEERRLFYVGITRAQTKLVLTYARLRYRFGEPAYLGQSRFLSEIGSEHIEKNQSRSILEPAVNRGNGARRTLVRPVIPQASNDEQYHKDFLPDYESDSQDGAEIRQGALVTHEMFGRGKILAISGKGDSRKAVVQFDGFGTKSLMIKYARLRPG
ncbi:MAG TPA: UvrD-helicase domain-containing protein [Bacteroidota bacterium]